MSINRSEEKSRGVVKFFMENLFWLFEKEQKLPERLFTDSAWEYSRGWSLSSLWVCWLKKSENSLLFFCRISLNVCFAFSFLFKQEEKIMNFNLSVESSLARHGPSSHQLPPYINNHFTEKILWWSSRDSTLFFPCYFSEPRRVATPSFARCGLFWFLIETNSEFSALFELVVGTQNSHWCSNSLIRCDMLTKRWWKLRTLSWIFDSIKKRRANNDENEKFSLLKENFSSDEMRVDSVMRTELGQNLISSTRRLSKFFDRNPHTKVSLFEDIKCNLCEYNKFSNSNLFSELS